LEEMRRHYWNPETCRAEGQERLSETAGYKKKVAGDFDGADLAVPVT